MKRDLKKLLERLEKIDPDSFQDLTDIIERHTENTEKLNMILDAIPKFITQRTGENEKEGLDIIPDILSCDTPDEVCEVINKWIKEKESDNMDLKKIEMLLKIKEKLEKKGNITLVYHGLKDISPCGDYPLFVQWNHKYPIIAVNTKFRSELMPLPKEMGFAIETILGNVKDEEDFQKQIDDYFKKKEEET